MEKNRFLCKCIITVLPTAVFSCKCFFFESGGIMYRNFSLYVSTTEVAQFETEEETAFKVGQGAGCPSVS